MIVTCEDCGASFNFKDSLIKPTGSKVRCSKCKSVFTVLPSTAGSAAETPAADLAPREEPASEAAAAPQDTPLTELDSKLDDIFGEEGKGTEMAELGEMTDLDFESAELAADPSDGDEGFELDIDTGADDLLAELDMDDLDLPASDDLEELAAEVDEDQALSEVSEEMDFELDLAATDNSMSELDDDELPQIDDLLDLSGEDIDLDADDVGELDAQLEADAEDLDADLGDALEMAGVDESDSDDLDLDLDLDDIAETASEEDITAAAMALELDGDGETSAKEAGDSAAADLDIDEIDLSDIEDMLSDDDIDLGAEATMSVQDGVDAEEIEDLDLSDFARELAEDGDQPEAVEASSDDSPLELDLDLGDEIAPEEPEAETSGADDELDFTDLADMLEPDESSAAATTDTAEDFDLEMGGATDIAADTGLDGGELDLDSMMEDAGGVGAEEELDLTLELDDLPGDAQAGVDSEPELEFDLDADLDDAGAGLAQEDELELNLLDEDEQALDLGGATTHAIGTDIAAPTDGGASTGAQEIGATTDDFSTEEFTDARDLTGDMDFMTPEEAAMPPVHTTAKRSRKPLMAVLAGLVLLIAALIIPNTLGIHIPVLSDIKIPYVSEWLGGDAKADVGNLRIIPLGKTINAKFVDNQLAGKLLIVSGQVRNEYEKPRSFIQMACKLFNKEGKVAKSATVYAGNMISTLDLARLDFTKIKDQLQNKSGQRKSNLNIKKGRVVPFMIVFDQLPSGLDEYTVEVVGSTPKK